MILVARQRLPRVFFAQCRFSSLNVAGRWFFTLSRLFFALSRRLLGRIEQGISLSMVLGS